jgi:dihydroorotate dehydrogenase
VRTIYKITPASAWREAERQGVYRGSSDDLRDGYIHFSTASQVAETARKHYFGQTGLFLVAVDADALGDALRWEPSRNDELFPHLYGELDLGAVTAILDVIRAFDAFSLPLLRWFDPEDAHRMAIQGLRLLPPVKPRTDDSKLAVRAFGLNFPNPIGMAAGFDKSAEVPDALLRLGFGFVEIGTVTPKPQGGNPRPRLFRLERDEAVINRMGFNNDGAEAALRRLAARANHGGIVGVNVGANKDSTDRVADYVKLIETFAPVASYFTVNVSSPNTPGLRNLQQSAALDELLAKVIDARERVRRNAGDSPVLLKIAPDLSLSELDDVVHIARSRRVDGMIVANTTLARPSTLREQARMKEQGGLSGRPLFRLSTRMVAETYVRTEGAFPLIGVGGIDSGGAALTKIRAGASLIQLYSSLVYKGLGLVEDIKNDLASTLLRTGRDSLSEIVGADAAAITAEDWPVV